MNMDAREFLIVNKLVLEELVKMEFANVQIILPALLAMNVLKVCYMVVTSRDRVSGWGGSDCSQPVNSQSTGDDPYHKFEGGIRGMNVR